MSSSSSSNIGHINEVILSAFAADSFSLGAHWEYNTDNISKAFKPQLTHLAAPLSHYHKGKTAGDQTHIGDNCLLLLQSLAEKGQFDRDSYLQLWMSKWDVPQPPAYVDHATKVLVKGTKSGLKGSEAASDDDDISHSAKFFPLLARYHQNEEDLVKQSTALTALFQRGPNELISAEFLARVTFRVLNQQLKPSQAIDEVTQQLNNEWLTGAVNLGKANVSAHSSALSAIRSLAPKVEKGDGVVFYPGLSCGVKYGIPTVVRSCFSHELDEDPVAALIEDVNLGGNSNGRSIAIATILFAHKKTNQKSQVQEWIKGLNHREEIEQLLQKIEKK